MSDVTSNNILQCLDSPMKILFWTVDEMVAISMPVMLGLALDWFFAGMVLSIAGFSLLRKFKNSIGEGGTLQQGLYWLLPTKGKLPKSSIREYLG